MKDEKTEKYKDIPTKHMKVNKELRDQIVKYREQISQVLGLWKDSAEAVLSSPQKTHGLNRAWVLLFLAGKG